MLSVHCFNEMVVNGLPVFKQIQWVNKLCVGRDLKYIEHQVVWRVFMKAILDDTL